MPVIDALIGIFLAKVIGMSPGNALLFAVLCANASYIAVPAAMRRQSPKLIPVYIFHISMALALTFPLNTIIGIPIYLEIINRIWG